ncbi:MAG: T9SS type A sorting domain-containing protein [Paludibacteraceae bacterium]
MKKFLSFLISCLVALPMMAIGSGDGSTIGNAVEFDWENGNVQESGAKWYRVSLEPIYDEDNPTLALFLTNLSGSAVEVHLTAKLMSETESRDYTIAAGEARIWSVGAKALIQTKQTEAYVYVDAQGKVALSAKVYETNYTDEACLEGINFDWNANATLGAGIEQWYTVDLRTIMRQPGKEVTVSVHNNAADKAVVKGAVSFDCPSSGTTDYTTTIAPNGTLTKTLTRAMMDMVADSMVYIRVSSTQPITISTTTTTVPSGVIFDAAGATELLLNTTYDKVAGTYIHKANINSARQKKMQPELTLTNTGTTTATVTAEIGFAEQPTSVIRKTITLAAGATLVRDVEKNLIDGINKDYEWAYLRLTTDGPIQFSARLKHIYEGDACKTGVDFDWQNGHTQEANSTVWYGVSLEEAKHDKKNIRVYIQNLGGSTATLSADFAFECPYTDLQSFVRSLAAGTTVDKLIDYSLFGMLAGDSVYVGLTTNQNVKFRAVLEDMPEKPKDDACLTAVPFDWVNGHKQAAGMVTWYKVGLDNVRGTTQLPYIVINNRSTSAIHIQGELSLECPDSIANATRSLTIGANGTYEKQVARDMLNSIDPAIDTVYVRLTADQDFSFRVRMQEEEAGNSCASAIDFNWSIGNDQPADQNLWYLVDLRQAKAEKKDVKVSITNKAAANASVSASLAFSCPCEAPQVQSTSLTANQTKSKTLLFSSLETADDTVYIRLSSTQAVHVEAELLDPEPFTPIDCPDDPKAFAWDTDYTETAGTAWYYLSSEILSQLSSTTLTPRLYLQNIAGSSNTITAELSYHCPVTSAMQSKSITLGNNQEVYKLLERTLAEQVAGKDTVMVRLTATGAYKFNATLVDPNNGSDCVHAVIFPVPNEEGMIQEAATTVWYRLDLKALTASNKKITFAITNTDATAGTVAAALFTSCDSAAIAERTFGLGSGQTRDHEFTSDVFQGFNSDYLYLQLTSAHQVKLTATVVDQPQLSEPITACEQAIAVVPNMDYTLSANTTAWYVVDLQNLRANTTGDGKLTVRNLTANELNAKAELSWICPVEYEMTYRQRTIPANGVMEQTLRRSQINQVGDSIAYVRVTTDQDLSFRFDITLSKGDECVNAIMFDWVNGNIHPGGEYLWYQVKMDSTLIPDTCDMRLYIVNLDTENTTDANADLYFDCNEAKLYDLSYTFEPGDVKYKDIDRDFLVAMGWADMIIQYSSNHNTKIYAELISSKPRQQDFDTIRATVCDGTDYLDTISNIPHFITSLNPEGYTWNDTVTYQAGVEMRDSIYTFIVSPIVIPAQPSMHVIDSIGAAPLLVQGMKIEVAPSLDKLKEYFINTKTDTTAAVTSIKWVQANNQELDLTTPLDKNTHALQLHLIIEDSCDNIIGKGLRDTIYTFVVEEWQYITTELFDTVNCAGDVSALEGLTPIMGDTLIRDTLSNRVITIDTLGLTLERMVDSVTVYNITMRTDPVLYTDLTVEPVVACGKVIDVVPATTILNLRFEGDKTDVTRPIESITWERKDTLTDTYSPIDATRLDSTEHLVVLRYVVHTVCGDLPSIDFEFVPTPYVYKAIDVSATVCPGEEYPSRNGVQTVYNDTTWNEHITIEDIDLTFDSVFNYTVSVHPISHETLVQTICAGDEVVIGSHIYNETGTYIDTLQSAVTGCDSIVTLMLTVQAPSAKVIATKDTINQGDSYEWTTWQVQTLTEAGIYKDTARYTTGCDSVYYELELTIRDEQKVVLNITDTVCAGTEYPGRLTVHTINDYTSWTDSVRYTDGATNIDSLYQYAVYAYVIETPEISADSILSVCGRAVNTAPATAFVEEYIAEQPLFAPNAQITWYIDEDGTWMPLGSEAIAGNRTSVTLKYTITTDCGSVESNTITTTVEMPDPSNAPEMCNLPATSKYNAWLLMINLNAIREMFPDWDIQESDVVWYEVVGTPDIEDASAPADDKQLATGFYYTIDAPLNGQYYATIRHKAAGADDCAGTASTVVLVCSNSKQAPALRPSVVRPEEQIEVLNLNPSVETTVDIYSTTGQKIATYTSRDAESFIIHAAQTTGYYMVDIQANGQNVTLRYVVQ